MLGDRPDPAPSGVRVQLRCGPEQGARLSGAMAAVGIEVVGPGTAAEVVVWAAPSGDAPVPDVTPARLLVLVGDARPAATSALFGAGAAAVLAVGDPPTAVARAVLNVARGYLVLAATSRRAVVHPFLPVELEPQEVAWLQALASGRSVASLATSSGCSERAMYRSLREVYRRLQAKGRADALELVGRAGLLSPG